MHSDHYDSLECRSLGEREEQQFAALRDLVAHAKASAPYYMSYFSDVNPARLVDRAALAQLPITRKSELIALQKQAPPFGGLLAVPVRDLVRIFSSPGPIHEPEPRGVDPWRSARALFAAGFRAGDLLHNCFSYHLTPAGVLFEGGAQALGCVVVPGGTGNSELQANTIAHLRPSGYIGTPDFLKVLMDTGVRLDLDLTSITRALVSGGPYLPDVRAFYSENGIAVYEVYGTAEAGVIAYETSARAGMVVNEGVIVEIIEPGGLRPVPSGEIGEVVVTTLSRAYPIIRFATGDLSAELPGSSPCGRTNTRLLGWLGRVDNTTKVKGQFVHPQLIQIVIDRHVEIRTAQLVVDRSNGADEMVLHCEVTTPDEPLSKAIQATLAAVTRINGRVVICPLGTLPTDAPLIIDRRRSSLDI